MSISELDSCENAQALTEGPNLLNIKIMWRTHEDYEHASNMSNVVTVGKDHLLNMKRSILVLFPVLCRTFVF